MEFNLPSFGANDFSSLLPSFSTSIIHLRLQKRTNHKCITIVEGLEGDKESLKETTKILRKRLNTSSTLIENETFGWIIQLAGDHRQAVADYLVAEEMCGEKNIRMHGE